MGNVNDKTKEQTGAFYSRLFSLLAHSITRCPLFSFGFQWIYLIIAILLPLFFENWTYSRFSFFFLFSALSLVSQSIGLLVKKKKVDYSGFTPKWYGAYLQKNAVHPEIERSMTGAFVCILFFGSLSSVAILQLSIMSCVPLLILMEWYLWHKK